VHFRELPRGFALIATSDCRSVSESWCRLAGDGGGCGGLRDDGERVVAEVGQDVHSLSHDPAALGQAGPGSRRSGP
jgi:hypothetical protein